MPERPVQEQEEPALELGALVPVLVEPAGERLVESKESVQRLRVILQGALDRIRPRSSRKLCRLCRDRIWRSTQVSWPACCKCPERRLPRNW